MRVIAAVGLAAMWAVVWIDGAGGAWASAAAAVGIYGLIDLAITIDEQQRERLKRRPLTDTEKIEAKVRELWRRDVEARRRRENKPTLARHRSKAIH